MAWDFPAWEITSFYLCCIPRVEASDVPRLCPLEESYRQCIPVAFEISNQTLLSRGTNNFQDMLQDSAVYVGLVGDKCH